MSNNSLKFGGNTFFKPLKLSGYYLSELDK